MKKADLITKDGWNALEAELKYLWKEERPRVTQSVSEAAALGDRSENAEYIYGKKRLREIDRRVRFLSKRMEVLRVVEPDPRQEGKVYFGAWVELENDDGDKKRYRLVGPDEFDVKVGKISIDSPLARALLGKAVDDEVKVRTPNGDQLFYINEIRYRAFED
ncbi:transcription elongation factor GreB [Ferrimonas balearica DSM 9799]|uniref:Transcription elongation factor GreB n=1 Tax=Ferrimonas balearica (strain DSM 9799 / CCM 4581 / KCTC 23876 / PAT) TaxID=550540 RepID=E1SL27_FERBD|nr:transcription elongation factor GreB [Ferrimonas balearica]MBY6019449.1 transcription elongation factor GreB [Halomonas denitrificans]ADN74421.1 transcription elongation factor GreB [Ferrimonas balearica DSM 9799]MBW3141158.1 transcription elongation factor GreB [Ferrimonas balearica]MBW3166013.1 transcription elongation factor GreB [Ferrimonas balearica]MBY5982061.1 transcription elongation factor GreB [Ferrimonas balearica]